VVTSLALEPGIWLHPFEREFPRRESSVSHWSDRRFCDDGAAIRARDDCIAVEIRVGNAGCYVCDL